MKRAKKSTALRRDLAHNHTVLSVTLGLTHRTRISPPLAPRRLTYVQNIHWFERPLACAASDTSPTTTEPADGGLSCRRRPRRDGSRPPSPATWPCSGRGSPG